MYRESTTTKAPNKNESNNLIHNPRTEDFKKQTKKSAFDVLNVGLIISLALLLRLCTSQYPYSGANTPPIYGDYEAQRHWQEVTLNLPISQWYSNSSNNDLQYWGLDYPPLTAYHSFLVACIAHIHDPKSVELHKSRGYESSSHKYFMRLSVLVVDMLIFIPAVLYFSFSALPYSINQNSYKKICSNDCYFISITLLCYPGIILIDYGHFQYNCVSLGFFIASVALIFQDSLMLGSCFFVLALNYKQMELYHALPFFFYILGLCFRARNRMSSLYLLVGVSLTVLVTFVTVWAPFLINVQVFTDVISRLFPIKRGIFEDKVANIWCTFNILYKLKSHISNFHLTLICLVTTVCALLPSCVDLFCRPSKNRFLLALINSSLAFFLCSFQVHEKSILLVAVPVLLYLHKDPFCCFWFLIISVFSILPLLIRDGLFVAYLALLTFFIIIVAWMEPQVFYQQSIEMKEKNKRKVRSFENYNCCINALFGLSLIGILFISICSVLIEPPKKYPDLYSLLISVYSCCHFSVFFIYFNYKQIFWTPDKGKLE
ncbi:probable dolichyl pyrophosphate Man9GlcNAc2 alpha-1,3-glucosyltransferase [Phymastichus coffea]|uniref:probable dolichyl pyrophosphate Man9GlcNAc2 alpha-1,3-glucosyltransferase n=1 Tax=Phymastichus coffea TaxID=108790 RepID=UPI00273AA926|nr:probable dolichyl pyrophosphate Man9GlcNAc2 alpha-1,3-glucosyltransferase [Phymastichus coffea]